MYFRQLTASLFLASALIFFGAAQSHALTVTAIETQGLRKVERDAVLEKLSFKVGNPFDAKKLRGDLQAIYDLGYFDEIEVLEDVNGDAVKVTLVFQERPVISEVEIKGNENISTKDLEEAIKVKKWSIVDITKIKEDLTIIQKQYEEKGFFLAHAKYELKPEKDGEVRLIYTVDDFEKVEIKRILFLNNRHYSDDKLKSVFMETGEGNTLSLLSSSGSFKESSFKNDLQRLMLFYLDNGYVKFKYENPVITVSEDRRYVTIAIYLDEGEKFFMGKTDFSGDLLFPKEELAEGLKLTEGKQFSITGRNADIQKLTEKYQDLGYAFVNVVPKMDINDETRTVSIDYEFEKGNLVYFGEIRVLGNSKTYDKVIRRELRIYEGELYSGSKLRVSRERVERLGYFAPGEVTFNQVTRKGRDDMVDIEITVKERSTGSITVGAGYSSVQSFFFTSQIQEINLFGSGRSISLNAQYGRQDIWRSFSVGFMDPYFLDSLWSAGFDLYMTNSPLPYRYLTRRTGLQLKTGYPLSDEIQGFLTYKLEHLRVMRDLAPLGAVADPTLDLGVLSSVVLSVVRDLRNNRFETTGGNYQNVSVEVAGLGGVKNFAKFTANNRIYWNFIGNFVFKNNTEFGAMINTGGAGIPPAEKFYLGGPWNMRGFEAFSLAPVIQGNGGVEQIGGASQLYSMFEIEHPLIQEAGLRWVTFYDIGNTYREIPLVGRGGIAMRQDWGFGVRWFSPLGPLRFEWGFPISPAINPLTGLKEDSPQFIFFIGQPF